MAAGKSRAFGACQVPEIDQIIQQVDMLLAVRCTARQGVRRN